MAWTNLAKRSLGYCIPKSWLDVFIDNSVYLYNALGGSGGSALNIVPNSSFENDVDADGIPDQWTRTLYTGGSGALVSTDSADAKFSYKFTHPGGAGNGGGYLTSDYVTWSTFRMLGVAVSLKCSVAGIKVIVRVKFYDKDKAFLSNVDVYTSTANPLVWALIYAKNIDTPATARFAKLELHGGVNDTAVAGDVYFDFAQIVDAEALPGYLPFTDSSIAQAEVNTTSAIFVDVGAVQNITIPAGTKVLGVSITFRVGAGSTGPGKVRFRIGTTYSTELTTSSTVNTTGEAYLDVGSLQGAQSLYFQAMDAAGSPLIYLSCPAANAKFCKTPRIVSDGALGTQAYDVT